MAGEKSVVGVSLARKCADSFVRKTLCKQQLRCDWQNEEVLTVSLDIRKGKVLFLILGYYFYLEVNFVPLKVSPPRL